jgi:hypothetical protein
MKINTMQLTIFGLGAFILGLGCGMGIIYMMTFYINFGTLGRYEIPLYRLAEGTSILYIIPLLIAVGGGLIAYAIFSMMRLRADREGV